MKFKDQAIEYNLATGNYQPLINGESTDLLKCVEQYWTYFPKATEVFAGILGTHLTRHPLLEDWLLIPHYRFFHNLNFKALRWFENLFDEAITLIGPDAWKSWAAETIQQTNCTTTHALCDRLYDFFLQLYGGIYLARERWRVGFIPPTPDSKRPDVDGIRDGKTCVLECKFIHSSEKHASFWRRFNTVGLEYSHTPPPLLFCDQFQFPSSFKMKSLSLKDCERLKIFTRRVYENPSQSQVGLFEDGSFSYIPSLSPALVPIDDQHQFAQSQGELFVDQYLKRLLEEAALQLCRSEYSTHEKILFIGFQPDALYLSSWNEPAISTVKSNFAPIAQSKGIKAVFSEDVNFCTRGYL